MDTEKKKKDEQEKMEITLNNINTTNNFILFIKKSQDYEDNVYAKYDVNNIYLFLFKNFVI